ncbi:hypothetical protein VTN96DRAFT_8110 [Rasamsonia emersonii]
MSSSRAFKIWCETIDKSTAAEPFHCGQRRSLRNFRSYVPREHHLLAKLTRRRYRFYREITVFTLLPEQYGNRTQVRSRNSFYNDRSNPVIDKEAIHRGMIVLQRNHAL